MSMLCLPSESLCFPYNSKKSIVIQQYYSFALFYPGDHLRLVVNQDHKQPSEEHDNGPLQRPTSPAPAARGQPL
jgi:hypothetical protein